MMVSSSSRCNRPLWTSTCTQVLTILLYPVQVVSPKKKQPAPKKSLAKSRGKGKKKTDRDDSDFSMGSGPGSDSESEHFKTPRFGDVQLRKNRMTPSTLTSLCTQGEDYFDDDLDEAIANVSDEAMSSSSSVSAPKTKGSKKAQSKLPSSTAKVPSSSNAHSASKPPRPSLKSAASGSGGVGAIKTAAEMSKEASGRLQVKSRRSETLTDRNRALA